MYGNNQDSGLHFTWYSIMIICSAFFSVCLRAGKKYLLSNILYEIGSLIHQL